MSVYLLAWCSGLPPILDSKDFFAHSGTDLLSSHRATLLSLRRQKSGEVGLRLLCMLLYHRCGLSITDLHFSSLLLSLVCTHTHTVFRDLPFFKPFKQKGNSILQQEDLQGPKPLQLVCIYTHSHTQQDNKIASYLIALPWHCIIKCQSGLPQKCQSVCGTLKAAVAMNKPSLMHNLPCADCA